MERSPLPPLPPQDLEYLISKAVDPKKADYAVFTGVQIHNWVADLNNTDVPSLEFVGVGKSYVVVNGEKVHLDLEKVPVSAAGHWAWARAVCGALREDTDASLGNALRACGFLSIAIVLVSKRPIVPLLPHPRRLCRRASCKSWPPPAHPRARPPPPPPPASWCRRSLAST